MTFFYGLISSSYRGGYLRYIYQYVIQIPVKTICEEKIAKNIRMLVGRMLELNQKLAAASVPAEKTMLQRQIDATDREIDQLVYQLYDLTPEEIKIVEG